MHFTLRLLCVKPKDAPTLATIGAGTLPKILEDLFAVEATDVKRKLIKLRVEFEEIRSEEQTLLTRLEEAIRRTEP